MEPHADDAATTAPAGADAPSGLMARLGELRERYFAKGMRYLVVSAFNVVFGQALLLGFQTVLELEPVTANMLAVSISAVPAYVLSRYWVWGRSGKTKWLTEVAPFWGLGLLGFILSTLAISGVTAVFDDDPPALIVNLTNLCAFGVIWVAKFFILDHWLFADRGDGHDADHDAEELEP